MADCYVCSSPYLPCKFSSCAAARSIKPVSQSVSQPSPAQLQPLPSSQACKQLQTPNSHNFFKIPVPKLGPACHGPLVTRESLPRRQNCKKKKKLPSSLHKNESLITEQSHYNPPRRYYTRRYDSDRSTPSPVPIPQSYKRRGQLGSARAPPARIEDEEVGVVCRLKLMRTQ